MKFSKRVTASLMTAALAASMTCALPAMASAAPAATGSEVATTYVAMAKTPATKITMKVNERQALKFYLKYPNGTKKKIKSTKVSWKSSNNKIATVDKKGFVTTKKEGKVTITGKYQGHTSYCKLTVKGDAARDFNDTVSALKTGMMSKLEPITENGETIYRYTTTEQDNGLEVTVSFDYNATTGNFAATTAVSVLGTSYGVELKFSDKYSDKSCTVTHYKNNQIVEAKTMKKSALKNPGEPTVVLGDSAIFQALEAGVIGSLAKDKDTLAVCKALGFTSIDK